MDEFGPLNLLPRPGKQWAPMAVKNESAQHDLSRRRRRRATFNRNDGVRHLMSVYVLDKDKLYGYVKVKKDRTAFLEFCRYLRTLHPAEVRLAIVIGNFSPRLSTRVDTRVGDWAEDNNVELANVATNASWLNRIEVQCQALRDSTLDDTDHWSHAEQNSMIRRYIMGGTGTLTTRHCGSRSSAQTVPDAARATQYPSQPRCVGQRQTAYPSHRTGPAP